MLIRHRLQLPELRREVGPPSLQVVAFALELRQFDDLTQLRVEQAGVVPFDPGEPLFYRRSPCLNFLR